MITRNKKALVQGGGIINDEVNVATVLNNAYINIVENITRRAPVRVLQSWS